MGKNYVNMDRITNLVNDLEVSMTRLNGLLDQIDTIVEAIGQTVENIENKIDQISEEIDNLSQDALDYTEMYANVETEQQNAVEGLKSYYDSKIHSKEESGHQYELAKTNFINLKANCLEAKETFVQLKSNFVTLQEKVQDRSATVGEIQKFVNDFRKCKLEFETLMEARDKIESFYQELEKNNPDIDIEDVDKINN